MLCWREDDDGVLAGNQSLILWPPPDSPARGGEELVPEAARHQALIAYRRVA